jgi:arylsulfatase A-like enzyme
VNQAASIVEPDLVTLAEHLQAAGYRTAGFGFNPHVFHPELGFAQGFEVLEEVRGAASSAPGADEFQAGPRAEQVLDRALAWLDGIGDEPSLLYVHLIDVHMPYRPLEPYAARFQSVPRPAGLDPWDLVKKAAELDGAGWAMLRDLYDAEVAYVDAQLGRFWSALERRGRAENTLLLFLSDHGEEFYEHGNVGHGEAQIYDEIVHVPLVLVAPRLPRAWRGARVPGLVQQIDVLPSVLELAGLPAEPALTGRSLFAHLRDPRAHGPTSTVGLVEAQSAENYRKAVVFAGRKYARTWQPAPAEELYDLRADPGERDDLLRAAPAVANRHRVLLDEHLKHVPGRYRFVIENTGAAALRVTGYLSTADVRLQDGRLEGCEPDLDGPYGLVEHQQDGKPAFAFEFRLDLPPGDRDELEFHPHPKSDRVDVLFLVDGVPGDPARVSIGPEGRHPAALPFALDLAKPEDLWAPEPAFPAQAPGAYRVLVYRMMDAVAPVGVLSEADKQALHALGYADD